VVAGGAVSGGVVAGGAVSGGVVSGGVVAGGVSTGVVAGGVSTGVVGILVRQPGAVNTLLSSETCPFRASALPSTVVSVLTDMDVKARIVPLKSDEVPKVAELPTCQ
jgi:hypothetical protein